MFNSAPPKLNPECATGYNRSQNTFCTLHNKVCSLWFIFHTLHLTLHSVHLTLHIQHFVFHTWLLLHRIPHFTFHFSVLLLHPPLFTVHVSWHTTSHFTLYTILLSSREYATKLQTGALFHERPDFICSIDENSCPSQLCCVFAGC